MHILVDPLRDLVGDNRIVAEGRLNPPQANIMNGVGHGVICAYFAEDTSLPEGFLPNGSELDSNHLSLEIVVRLILLSVFIIYHYSLAVCVDRDGEVNHLLPLRCNSKGA